MGAAYVVHGACSGDCFERFARLLAEENLATQPSSSPAQVAFERAGYKLDDGNAYRLANNPVIKRRIKELTAEALEYSDIRIAQVAVRLSRIAAATMPEYFESDGVTLKNITTLPDRLADAVREVEYHEDGSVKRIRLHDKLAAASVLMKHLGGFPEERMRQQVNNTQVNIEITDEQRIAALMALFARAEATSDCDSVREPVEQLPAPIQK